MDKTNCMVWSGHPGPEMSEAAPEGTQDCCCKMLRCDCETQMDLFLQVTSNERKKETRDTVIT